MKQRYTASVTLMKCMPMLPCLGVETEAAALGEDEYLQGCGRVPLSTQGSFCVANRVAVALGASIEQQLPDSW
jgi:hypothetical protein